MSILFLLKRVWQGSDVWSLVQPNSGGGEAYRAVYVLAIHHVSKAIMAFCPGTFCPDTITESESCANSCGVVFLRRNHGLVFNVIPTMDNSKVRTRLLLLSMVTLSILLLISLRPTSNYSDLKDRRRPCNSAVHSYQLYSSYTVSKKRTPETFWHNFTNTALINVNKLVYLQLITAK